MKHIFVLDTNVLIHDPKSIFRFEDNDIIIPITVIEELDELKKGDGEIPYSARQALKLIGSLCKNGNGRHGDLSRGVALPNGKGGTLRIATDEHSHLSVKDSPDNRIISVAASTAEKNSTHTVAVVSKDTAVRIKAESFGILSQDYKHDKTSIYKEYGRILSREDCLKRIRSVRYVQSGPDLIRLQGRDTETRIRNGRSLDNISPKNVEQACAIDALTRPDIEVVALTGTAGTGKTLLALSAALHQTTKKSPLYEQVLVGRPTIPLGGNDIGFLPGDIQEKLHPWMQPIFDNLEIIVGTPKGLIKDNMSVRYRSYQYLIDSGILQIEPLTYIRGRSLPRRYFIIDEAQQLRPIDTKTIITRCGENTKIVFTGDLEQVDHPFLDSYSNGLAYLISKFINEKNFCYLNLSKTARSSVAEQASRLL
ncbi:MAG TPA: PhoH family protein [Thermodesulfovibrionales bacterium]|nr:PhoH family protein [Thermodesulfovibrionales bacterium]